MDLAQYQSRASQVALVVKNPLAKNLSLHTGDRCEICGFNPWVRKLPWNRKRQSTPVFLLWESQGQRSLAGYSPWGHKESDTTESLTLSLFTYVNLKSVQISQIKPNSAERVFLLNFICQTACFPPKFTLLSINDRDGGCWWWEDFR